MTPLTAAELDQLIKDGIVEYAGGVFYLTEKGIAMMDAQEQQP